MEGQADRAVEESGSPLYEKQLDEVCLTLVYRYRMSRKKQRAQFEEMCQQTFERTRNNRSSGRTRGSNVV